MKSWTSSKTGQIRSLILEFNISPWFLRSPLFGFVISITHSVLIGSSWNLEIWWTWMKARIASLKTGQIRSLVLELHPLDCWKKGTNFDISLTHSVLIGSSWNLQIRGTSMKSGTSLKTGQIGSLILELHPLDCWKSPFRNSLIWVCTFYICHFVKNIIVQNFRTFIVGFFSSLLGSISDGGVGNCGGRGDLWGWEEDESFIFSLLPMVLLIM